MANSLLGNKSGQAPSYGYGLGLNFSIDKGLNEIDKGVDFVAEQRNKLQAARKAQAEKANADYDKLGEHIPINTKLDPLYQKQEHDEASQFTSMLNDWHKNNP